MMSSPRPSIFLSCVTALAAAFIGLGSIGCSKGGPRFVENAPDAGSATAIDGIGLQDGGAATASSKGPPPNLNILLITVDSLRADMPWAGYERPIAPNLTEFEKRAVSYTHAYSLSSYTSMSVGGL